MGGEAIESGAILVSKKLSSGEAMLSKNPPKAEIHQPCESPGTNVTDKQLARFPSLIACPTILFIFFPASFLQSHSLLTCNEWPAPFPIDCSSAHDLKKIFCSILACSFSVGLIS